MYGTVEELLMGNRCMQILEKVLYKQSQDKESKFYIAALILAYSRYRYEEWLDLPFHTADSIRRQENAFHYFVWRNNMRPLSRHHSATLKPLAFQMSNLAFHSILFSLLSLDNFPRLVFKEIIA